MTSTPASRSALATTFAPRSWPSRPGLAMTTRMLLTTCLLSAPRWPYAQRSPICLALRRQVPGQDRLRLQLLDRRVTQDQVLDPVVAAEVDLGFRIIATALDRQHPAQPIGVMSHMIAGRARGHRPVAEGLHAAAARQPFRGGRRRRRLVPPPLDQLSRDLGQEP